MIDTNLINVAICNAHKPPCIYYRISAFWCFVLFFVSTNLSLVELWVVGVVCEEEHVYKVDQYTGSYFGLGRSVGNPLEDHHEHQVTKERHHEDQLWDEHEEHTADLTKVPGESKGAVNNEYEQQQSC